MIIVISCLICAVAWMYARVTYLDRSAEELRAMILQLRDRLQEFEDAKEDTRAPKVASASAQPEPAVPIPPLPVAEAEAALTTIAPATITPVATAPGRAGNREELRSPSVRREPQARAILPIPVGERQQLPPVLAEPEESGAKALRSNVIKIESKRTATPPPLETSATASPAPSPANVSELSSASAPVREIPTPMEATGAPAAAEDSTPAASPSPRQSFELRLGTYWFVRAGVVILLTGFVFLANLAYRQMGAGGRIGLLYLASGVLLGAGLWLQRKSAPASLNNFAHVLLAGGLGAVYFTTYAAHHYEPLRIIESAALDGGLLLAWAGVIVWLADQKKSETLALFALGLGYYTAVVTRVGTFTLCSNLVLTIATVFFLVRNRWAHLTLAGLVASYGGFAFWRFFHDGHWLLNAPRENLLLATVFLAGYWVCFTAATFLAEGDLLADKRRAAFLSANNGAFFVLVALSMATQRSGNLWEFCLGLGAVLLGLAAYARLRLPQEPSVRAAYVTQGLLLVTVGMIVRFTGHQLAVLLAAESVALLTLGLRQPSRLLRAGAYVTAKLAVGWFVLGWEPGRHLALGVGISGLLLFNAWWMGRHEDPENTALLRARTAWFSGLALIAVGATIFQQSAKESIALWLMAAGLGLTLSVHVVRTREIALLAQGCLVLAHCWWLLDSGSWGERSDWRMGLFLAGSLALLHWWTRQTVLGGARLRAIFESGYAVAVVALLNSWLRERFTEPELMVTVSALALAVTAYGAITRAWRLSAAAQFFTLAAGVAFARHLQMPHPGWGYALAPIGAFLVLAMAVQRGVARRPDLSEELASTLRAGGEAYRWTTCALIVAMVFSYVPVAHRPWAFGLLGGLLFACAGWWRTAQTLLRSGFLIGLALLTLLVPGAPAGALFTVPNLLAALLPLVLQQIARRAPERFPMPADAHVGLLLCAGGLLWWHLTRWLMWGRDEHFFSLAGSVLGPAFVVAGLRLKERTYYLLGFGCVGIALFRVLVHEAWRSELFALSLLPVFVTLGLQRLVRKHPDGAGVPDAAHAGTIFLSGVILCVYLTRWVLPERDGYFLTSAWAVLGPVFLLAGWWLRERTYFLLGLGCLGLAQFRVIAHDVWQPELFALNMLPMVALLALQRIARKQADASTVPDAAHIGVIGVSGFSVWLFLTRWLMVEGQGFYLTLAWSLLAPAFLMAGVWLRERAYFLPGVACLGAVLVRAVTLDAWRPAVFVPNVLPAIFLLVLQRVVRNHASLADRPESEHTAAIVVGGLTLWLFLSRWVVQVSGGKFLLTASWAVLALGVFAAGFAMRERVYRWLGLAVLAGALGRVVVLDIWQLTQVYRVLSFMALGIALIVLGYVYNRCQEKIREWL